MTNVELNIRAGTVAKIALITALVNMGMTAILCIPIFVMYGMLLAVKP